MARTLDTLPTEILIEVYKRLQTFHEASEFQLTCRRIHRVWLSHADVICKSMLAHTPAFGFDITPEKATAMNPPIRREKRDMVLFKFKDKYYTVFFRRGQLVLANILVRRVKGAVANGFKNKCVPWDVKIYTIGLKRFYEEVKETSDEIQEDCYIDRYFDVCPNVFLAMTVRFIGRCLNDTVGRMHQELRVCGSPLCQMKKHSFSEGRTTRLVKALLDVWLLSVLPTRALDLIKKDEISRSRGKSLRRLYDVAGTLVIMHEEDMFAGIVAVPSPGWGLVDSLQVGYNYFQPMRRDAYTWLEDMYCGIGAYDKFWAKEISERLGGPPL